MSIIYLLDEFIHDFISILINENGEIYFLN